MAVVTFFNKHYAVRIINGLIRDPLGLRHLKHKRLQKPSDYKRQRRPLALYRLCIHHNHGGKCIQNMNVTRIDVKRLLSCVLLLLAVTQSRTCCHRASAVKKLRWQRVWCWQGIRQGSAARRPKVGPLKRNSAVDVSFGKTPSDSPHDARTTGTVAPMYRFSCHHRRFCFS